MPAALILRTTSRNSAHVAGGAAICARSKSSLLYQKPTMPASNGTPYCLPSIWYSFTALGSRLPIQDSVSLVRSLTRPASTCCLSTPPPHEWNTSGGLPACVTVVSLDL